jgi:hypothetical protein
MYVVWMRKRLNANDPLENGHLIKLMRRWKDKVKMGLGEICCMGGSGLCQMAVFSHVILLLVLVKHLLVG